MHICRYDVTVSTDYLCLCLLFFNLIVGLSDSDLKPWLRFFRTRVDSLEKQSKYCTQILSQQLCPRGLEAQTSRMTSWCVWRCLICVTVAFPPPQFPAESQVFSGLEVKWKISCFDRVTRSFLCVMLTIKGLECHEPSNKSSEKSVKTAHVIGGAAECYKQSDTADTPCFLSRW